MPRQARTRTLNKNTPDGMRPAQKTLVLALGGQLNALMSALRALTVDAATALHPDLPPAAFHIAHWLHSFGAANVSRVAEAVAMDRSATSRLTARLIEIGLVEARPDPADGRGVVLDLTNFGRKSIDRANARKRDVFLQKIETWSDADLELLTALLRRFNELPPRNSKKVSGRPPKGVNAR